MIMSFWETVQREARVIKGAPWSFVAIVAVAGSATWFVADQWNERQTRFMEAQLDAYRQKEQMAGTGPANPAPLSRPVVLAYSFQTGLGVDRRPVAESFTVQIANRSRDWPIRVTMKRLRIIMNEKLVLDTGRDFPDIDPESYGNETFDLNDIEIPRGTDKINFDVVAQYDSVPSTGVRTEIRHCVLPLVWSDPERSPPSPTNASCKRDD
jgi:hypothetical protein